MDLDEFRKKHKDLFDLGVCEIIETKLLTTIIIDRFDGKNFLCEHNKLKPAQNDARKMGFISVGIGEYWKQKF